MSPLSKKIVKLKARICAGVNSFDGYIENYSADEIYVVTLLSQSVAEFSSGLPVKLKIELNSKEIIDLTGRVKWSYMTPPHCLTRSTGIEVMGPHLNNSELFTNLH